ncbi:SDR family oxidoreductase [Streptomyces sp. SL13]|uniref:SDR family oxidoreductase n=1 Tax=Streptantibioticus silvisoli TaxID=2705255 RepID=A0AA90HD03_9ACTN|nr:SDR family oxidoreductase [Streptantibioticus silvisoli]MDI5974404.1 SDR family oxidoreductase [Streptantibioticus silvisoli]
MPVAIVTGASRGLGLALARGLSARGWDLVLDARSPEPLRAAARGLPGSGEVVPVPGDVTDAAHRAGLVAAARGLGGVDLLVNNASALGAAPLVPLAELAAAGLREALETNVVAPAELTRAALPALRAAGAGAVLNVTSDAAVEAYSTWGGYGASKAALERWSAVLAVEEPAVRVWWVDPGDLRTALYAAACPDDPGAAARPEPGSVVPSLLRLVDAGAPSGRYTASALAGAV